MAHAIQTSNLGKTFTTKTAENGFFRSRVINDISAVSGITLDVAVGERVAFIGPNGAGKSTTIRMLAGILHPSSGEASVLGLVPHKQRKQLSFRIGTIFGQRSQLIPDLAPRATFDLLSRIYRLDRAAYHKRRDSLMESFAASDLLDHPVRFMSLGQRMRCELIASLLHSPRILFLDEPTIGLDLMAKRTLRDMIVALNDEHDTTLLLTSHDVADVETVAQRVVIIDHGKLIFDGNLDKLRNEFLQTKLVDVWFGDDEVTPSEVPGCTVTLAHKRRFTFSIDLTQRRVGDVLNDVVASRVVDDIEITDPPLEDVIGHIYLRGRG